LPGLASEGAGRAKACSVDIDVDVLNTRCEVLSLPAEKVREEIIINRHNLLTLMPITVTGSQRQTGVYKCTVYEFELHADLMADEDYRFFGTCSDLTREIFGVANANSTDARLPNEENVPDKPSGERNFRIQFLTTFILRFGNIDGRYEVCYNQPHTDIGKMSSRATSANNNGLGDDRLSTIRNGVYRRPKPKISSWG